MEVSPFNAWKYQGGQIRRSVYRENVKCRICGSRRHFDLLHLSSAEKKERAKEAGTVDDSQDNVNAKYTLVGKGTPGGLSCSKSVSVDIYGENHCDAPIEHTLLWMTIATLQLFLPSWRTS